MAHGNVAQCLMDAVQGILGTQSNWVAVSNTGMGLTELRDAVDAARWRVWPLKATRSVISDMPGGSCHHVCQEIVASAGGVRALTGVNLMMLLEFFVKRERAGVDRTDTDGQRARSGRRAHRLTEGRQRESLHGVRARQGRRPADPRPGDRGLGRPALARQDRACQRRGRRLCDWRCDLYSETDAMGVARVDSDARGVSPKVSRAGTWDERADLRHRGEPERPPRSHPGGP